MSQIVPIFPQLQQEIAASRKILEMTHARLEIIESEIQALRQIIVQLLRSGNVANQ